MTRFLDLIYFSAADRGESFAAWERPELFASKLRVTSRSLMAHLSKAHLLSFNARTPNRTLTAHLTDLDDLFRWPDC